VVTTTRVLGPGVGRACPSLSKSSTPECYPSTGRLWSVGSLAWESAARAVSVVNLGGSHRPGTALNDLALAPGKIEYWEMA
jgi:hypothetical protein